MEKLLNILLLPKELYKKLTDNKFSLIMGIAIVGLIDMFLPDVTGTYTKYFVEKPDNVLLRNIVFFVVLVALIGFVDVLVISLPLRDIFKFFKKEFNTENNNSVIRIMKIYIISHFIIIPVNIVLYYTVFRNLNELSSPGLLLFAVLYSYIIIFWSTAIMYRGINAIYNFQPLFKRLVFSVVLLWGFIWSTVLDYIIGIVEQLLLV
ncbi:MAG TPA: hypothetical protein GXX20_04495 [Clostridiaceae bacterium]|nr:hypothetical protein [Clostridiaceae bacterium]